MKKLTIILIGLLTYILAIGQTYSSITSDKEIYDFLNWVTINNKKNYRESKLRRKQICYKIFNWDESIFFTDTIQINNKQILTNFFYLYKAEYGGDTIFNQQDKDFIFQQFTAIKDSIWHKSFSNSRLRTHPKKRPNRYYYSIPLFSIDKNYVVVVMEYYCGNECAYGGYYVYQRISEKKWKFVTILLPWIS
jgi:hypothetical protein